MSRKCTKVQTLGAGTTTACTDDTSIAGLILNCAIVSCLVFHAVESVHVHMCTYYSPAPRLGPLFMHVQSYR